MLQRIVSRMTVNALNSAQTFESWARDYYEPSAIRHYDRLIARMLKWLQPPPGSEILDAGCGTGVHSIRAAQCGYRVRAIDVSTVALRRARQLALEANLSDAIEFQSADLTRLPFDDQSFQTIFSWGVVIHIEDMEQALRELARVLKPGGRLALQITNRAALDHRLMSLARFITGRPKRYVPSQFGIGAWDGTEAGQLWTELADIPTVLRYMNQLSCNCIHRSASEFTELQRKCNGAARAALRCANDMWSLLRLPASPACTNLLIFEKRQSR
jgi:ubiquinone/menaquinone biosynthesis C-methylase UbiE